MKKSDKKGFTIVELIVVVATLAILAAVLIPTFAGIIKKANDSAYQQERTNQMIQDAVEKIEKGDKYMSWEDLEEAIAEALKNQESGTLLDKIITIIKDKDSTGMTDEQLTAILEAIANKKLSDVQVKVILDPSKITVTGMTPEQIKEAINEVIAKLPQVGITQEDITAAVNAVLIDNTELAEKINKAIEDALKKIPTLNEAAIAAIVEQILESTTIYTVPYDDRYAGVIKKADGSYVYFNDLCTVVSGKSLRINGKATVTDGVATRPKDGDPTISFDTIILFKDVYLFKDVNSNPKTYYEYLDIYLGNKNDELSINLNGCTLDLGVVDSSPGKTKGISVTYGIFNISNGTIKSKSNIMYAANNGRFHIKNVNMDCDYAGTYSTSYKVIHSATDCSIVNSKIVSKGKIDVIYSSKNLVITNSTINAEASEANVIKLYGGTVTCNNVNIEGNEHLDNNTYYMIYFDKASTLNINGGNFTEYTCGKKYDSTNATISITGGTFDADPTAYVPAGYHVTDNGNGTWTVSAD